MATAYSGVEITAGKQPRVLPEGCEIVQIGTYLNAVAFVINDTVKLVQLQADPTFPGNGPSITSLILDVPALDSSTGIVTAVGDSGTAARFISGATVGRSGAGGIQGPNVAGTYGYQPFLSDFGSFGTYTAVSNQVYTIVFKVTTAATGTATTAGTIALKVGYTYDR